MPNFGGLVAALSALGWAIVYACTQEILINISPLEIVSATYLFSGLISLIPFAYFGSTTALTKLFSENPFGCVFYLVMTLFSKFCMISAIKFIGATAAGLIEISYVSGTDVV